MIAEKNTLLNNLGNLFDSKTRVQKDAWDMLSEVGLPHKKSEAYKYTHIISILEKKIDYTLDTTIRCDVGFYQTEGNHLVFTNGSYNPGKSQLVDPLNIQVGEVTEGRHDPFSLLNTALGVQEVLITIDKTTKPIFLYHSTSATISNPRVKVEVKSNNEVNLYEKIGALDGSFTNSYIEFDIAKNSVANYTKVQDYRSLVYTHEIVVVNQERDSRFYSNVFSFSSGLTRNNLILNLKDENCEGHMHGLYLLDGKSHVDNNTSVEHIRPNSYSNELYKGILDERSKGVFNGKIYVRQDAQKTNAFQSNNNILLSDDATVNTKPQLEIWADDVKCSHGCTTGQLDEDAIFYLRARGIGEKHAKAMILNAFASETLVQVKEEEVKNELIKLINQKLG